MSWPPASGPIDAHQHFWDLERVEYPWLSPDLGPIHRSFEPAELEPLLDAAGIARTVLVQAANSFEDTAYMLEQADRHSWIAGVVGWLPLLEPGATESALERYARQPKLRGVRHLVHNEPDPDWLLREPVATSLALVAERGLAYDIPAEFPLHLEHVPALAERLPQLTIVIDHLAKPPLRGGDLDEWARQLAAAAAHPNVCAKVSGLNTAADPERWSAADLRPAIDIAFDRFGPERLMFGSDWPVCLLAGDYDKVWRETLAALEERSPAEVHAVLEGTAERVYGLRRGEGEE